MQTDPRHQSSWALNYPSATELRRPSPTTSTHSHSYTNTHTNTHTTSTLPHNGRYPSHPKPPTATLPTPTPAPPNQSILDEVTPSHSNVRREPTHHLYHHQHQHQQQRPLNRYPSYQHDVRATPATPATGTAPAPLSHHSVRHRYTDTHTDPFYEATAPELQRDLETWVTVFGFPPSRAAYVLQQFEAYGDVVEHRMGSGNWMHIRYATALQAKKALGKNGKVFEGVLMVGVCACIDPDVVRRRPQHRSTSSSPPPIGSNPTFPPHHRTASSTSKKPPRTQPEPQRGLLSRAMDNIFLV